MYSCKLTVISYSVATNEAVSKDYNGVNRNYIGNLGTERHDPAEIEGVSLPDVYGSFWEWAQAVARGINSLTTNTYNNCRVQAVFDVNQEVNV